MDDLRTTIGASMPQTIEALTRLVAIPSIGYPGYDPSHVRRSAELTAALLREAGVADAALWELDGGHPAVFGSVDGPAGAPTVLLYAHHDVQPAGDEAAWTTPPFEPVVRDGRLFGRGAADDKAGIAIHVAALRALLADGPPPVTVKVLIEGEEECTAEHLPQLIGGHRDQLHADVAIIADGGNERTGMPTIGTSVRGSTAVQVRVDVLPRAVHSGAYGGPLPDAIMSLARIIAALHDDDGVPTLEGMHAFTWAGRAWSEADFRDEANVPEGVRLLGEGPIADQVLARPSINVLAIEAVPIHEAANQIVPSARAVIGLRIPPGEDPSAAQRRLIARIHAVTPWGVEVTITPDEPSPGYLVDDTTAAYRAAGSALAEAFDRDVIAAGSGGSIPLVPMLADTFPGIAVLIVGAGDHRSNFHSVDESVDLGDLERMALAEALLLRRLGEP
jgi:acetylornithine deacetylase/succinyl-diaminopimelate desuccinylase-like protein